MSGRAIDMVDVQHAQEFMRGLTDVVHQRPCTAHEVADGVARLLLKKRDTPRLLHMLAYVVSVQALAIKESTARYLDLLGSIEGPGEAQPAQDGRSTPTPSLDTQ